MTGVVQVTGELIATRRVGAYQHLTFVAPGIAELARPGQFVALAVGGDTSANLLRRCFSIHKVSPSGTYGGTVDIVVAAHGPGTTWITRLALHDEVDIVGPLGKPFPLPTEPVPCVLVGGGYGSAPLFWLAEQLAAKGCHVEMVLGAASEDRLFGVVEARRAADGLTVTTDDGSAGTRGWVSDVLPQVIRLSQAGVVYGCGPMGMLRSITEVAAAQGIVAQVAVEESMACGVGVCMTCVMPVTGADGTTRMVRSCVEGPVFRGDRVRWDAFENGYGRVPVDAVGRAHGDGSLMVDMSVTLADVELPNPLMTASGCAANGKELHRFFDVATLGAFVTKSVMAAPRSGRGTPRMAETPSGMLNSIGLQGPGIHAFVENDLAWLHVGRGEGTGVDRRRFERGVRRRGRRAAPEPGLRLRRRRRGQHLLPQRREPRSRLRHRPAGLGQGRRPGPRAAAPSTSRCSPSSAPTSPTSRRSRRRASRPGRTG